MTTTVIPVCVEHLNASGLEWRHAEPQSGLETAAVSNAGAAPHVVVDIMPRKTWREGSFPTDGSCSLHHARWLAADRPTAQHR
jgi:hypothetical protein